MGYSHLCKSKKQPYIPNNTWNCGDGFYVFLGALTLPEVEDDEQFHSKKHVKLSPNIEKLQVCMEVVVLSLPLLKSCNTTKFRMRLNPNIFKLEM